MITLDRRSAPAIGLAVLLAAAAGFAIGSLLGGLSPTAESARLAESSPAMTRSALPVTPSPRVAVLPSPSDVSAVPTQALRTPLIEMHGTADDLSEVFTVTSAWQVEWETIGTDFKLELLGNKVEAMIADYQGSASGVTRRADLGEFQLKISGRGPWSVVVLQGESESPGQT